MTTLSDIPYIHSTVGMSVTYVGDNREYLRGRIGQITRVSTSNRSVRVQYLSDNGQPEFYEWAADWAWELVEDNKPLTADDILNPHTRSIGAIDAEIKRLNERIAELTKTREVLSSL